jgi:hypothetical protein
MATKRLAAKGSKNATTGSRGAAKKRASANNADNATKTKVTKKAAKKKRGRVSKKKADQPLLLRSSTIRAPR